MVPAAVHSRTTSPYHGEPARARADESPRRFALGKRWVEATEIIHRWRQGEGARGSSRADCFEVRGADQRVYRLEHDLAADEWFLVRRG
jgi:hypothetical protein